ncbi:MAG: acyl carrier protein [Betaproteobacteria bacterium]|nr:acyl carrier protein [Betaproteobacteria bacterium]
MSQITTAAIQDSPPTEAGTALQTEVAGLIVTALNLEIKPEDINPDDALFGDGLGLDSIDILEVALEVSKRYGFQLRADNEDNVRIFRSLRSLADHIAGQRTL